MPALGKPLGDGSAGLSGCWLLAAAGSSPAVTVPSRLEQGNSRAGEGGQSPGAARAAGAQVGSAEGAPPLPARETWSQRQSGTGERESWNS